MKPRGSLSTTALVAGAVAGVAVLATGALTGLVPRSESAPLWGAGWSRAATGADAVAMAALADRIDLARGLLVLVACLALFTVVLLLVGGRERHRPSLAVRSALGAAPRELARHLLRLDRTRLCALVGAGLAGGLLTAGLLRWSWPAPGAMIAVPAESPTAAILLGAFLAGPVLAALIALALLAPLPGLGSRSPTLLRRGHGVTDDPRAGTVRRGAATLQVGLSFALAITGVALVRGTPALVGAGGLADASRAAPRGPLVRLASTGTVDAGELPRAGGAPRLLGSPGVWTGVGARDLVTVECGACVRGMFYLPIYGVDSTVHAVTPGVIEALGGAVVEGRAIEASDGAGAPLVGVVNEAFRAHFQDRAPVGRRIRLSGPGDRWVEVVGVVSDPPFRGPGAPAPDEPALWLSLAQHPAPVVEGRIGTSAPPRGWTLEGEVRGLPELRSAALAPVSWAGWVLLLSGIAALALALASSAEVARVEARGRARSAAVRLALGAPPRGPALRILRRALKGGVQGVVLGLAVSWALGEALGVGGEMSVGLRLVLALGVLGATLWGTRKPLRRLRHLQPAALLREE